MGQMGVDTLKNNLTNPARIYLWDFEIPAPKGSGSTDVWFIRAQTATIPGKSFEDIDINYKGTGGYRVPGRERFDHNYPVTVIEGEDRLAFTAINSWQNQIRGTNGVGEPDSALKTDAIITLNDNKESAWLRIKLVGIYPKEVGNVDLTYDNSGNVKFNVVFSYDRWEPMD
jgi:hypothetical protein